MVVKSPKGREWTVDRVFSAVVPLLVLTWGILGFALHSVI